MNNSDPPTSSSSPSPSPASVLPVTPNTTSPYFNRQHPPFKPTDSTEIYNMRQRHSQLSSPNASPKLSGTDSDTHLLDAFLLKASASPNQHHNSNTNTVEEGSKENRIPDVNIPIVSPIHALNESASSMGNSVYHTPNTFPSSVMQSTLNSPITAIQSASNSNSRPIPASINATSLSSPAPPSHRGQLTPANLLQSITKQQISQSQIQRSFGSPMAPPSFGNFNGNSGLLSPSRSPQQLYRYSPIATQLGALSPPPAKSNAALDFLKSTHVPSFVGMSNAVHIIRETSRPSSPSAGNGGGAAVSRRPFAYAAANGPLPPPVFPRSHSRPNSSMSTSSILSRERSNGPSPADLNPPMTLTEWLKHTPVPTPLKRNQDGILLSPEAPSVGSNNNNDASSATPAPTTTIAAISTAALLSPASAGASSTPSSGSDMQPPLMSASVNSSTPLRTPIASPPSNSTPMRSSLPMVALAPPTPNIGSGSSSDQEQEHDSPAEALFTATTVNLFDIPPSTADSSETDAMSSSSSSVSPSSSASSESSSSRTHARLIEEQQPSVLSPSSSPYKHDSIAELLTTDEANNTDMCVPTAIAAIRPSIEETSIPTQEEKDVEVIDPVKALMMVDAAAETCASAPAPIPSDADSAASFNSHVTIAVTGAVVVGAAFAAYVNRKWIEEKLTTFFRR